MTIQVSKHLLHWNYFLALEEDLARVSRYVEFSEANFKVYSIELAHLLLASSSEVDVIAKLLCEELDPNSTASNINEYRKTIVPGIPSLTTQIVHVPRFGLQLRPWSNWEKGNRSPLWWRKHNLVKHQRNDHFNDANLKHALNALCALLVVVFHYYRLQQGLADDLAGRKDTTMILTPDSSLLRLPDEFYRGALLIE